MTHSAADRDLGFGIVGCGLVAPFHVAALRQIPGCRVVALQSRRRENAERVAAAIDSAPTLYSDLAAFLRHPGLDVVCICTPSGNHLEPAQAAAAAGKHVVVEKPLEITLERCDALIAACAGAGVRLMTIFPARFAPASEAARAALHAGRLGRLTLAEASCKWWRTQAYYDDGGWKGTRALDGGGALMNQAIHTVDLLLWLAGPVHSVFGFTSCLAHERIEVEDTAVGCLQFASGALGVIQAATSAYPGLPRSVALHGSAGTIVLEEENLRRWEFAQAGPADDELRQRLAGPTGGSGASDPAGISAEPPRRQLAAFVAALREGRPSPAADAEGRRAVELILALYESARLGQPVKLAN